MKAQPRWKCKDGRHLLVTEMEPDHIRNCIAKIRRAGYVSIAEHGEMPSPCGFGGDSESMASYYSEMSWEYEADQWLKQKRTAWLDLFEDELRQRGLAVCA